MTKRHLLMLTAIALVALVLFLGYQTLYPEARNILEEKTAHTLTAQMLFEHFSEENGSQYIDQAIITSGKATEIDKKSMFLDNKVQVNFGDYPGQTIEIGDYLIVKGRCIGFDDLLGVVKIDQATITN